MESAPCTPLLLSALRAFSGLSLQYECRDEKSPKELEDDLIKSTRINVIGQIHLFSVFLPLILKGKAKKVIALSSGHADPEMVNKFDVEVASLYTISKAALNMAVAKFNAQYKKDGVLFLALSPGMVDTGNMDNSKSF